ncbi:MAG: hypothetical protein A2V67_00895 [Deltaproteobacteria bacterium RBG_13_61_14]|nr:MAG: hypothetical protein A2V67_00895 [Deltaproteobacteria bacterium RBG_13_61_14]
MSKIKTLHAVLALGLWASVFPGLLGLGPQALAIIIYPQAYSTTSVPEVITPVSLYSNVRMKSVAALYRLNQEHVVKAAEQFPPDSFRLLTTAESSVGGVGFWMNPAQFGNPDRYLGVFAKVVVPGNTPFRNDQPGRVAAVMDRYGKPALEALAKELSMIPDPGIKGGALIFVFSREPLSSPSFFDNAEAMVLYIPKPDLITFSQYRLTLQALFNQSDLFMFEGADQMQTLTRLFIQL